MTAVYKTLFSIDLMHEYYKTGFCKDFKIFPSPPTVGILASNQLIYRHINHQLIVLIKVSPGKPGVEPDFDKDRVLSKLSVEMPLVSYLVQDNLNFFMVVNNQFE
jgi:hypothetical protein